jgi:hypothetical protein
VGTLIGCPVHVPNRCRSGVPAVSQISSPTSDQPLPVFVHETVPEFEVVEGAPAVTAFQEMLEPPVVYPEPPASSVMSLVAVGAFVPRRIWVAVTVVYGVAVKIAARRAAESFSSNIAMADPA